MWSPVPNDSAEHEIRELFITLHWLFGAWEKVAFAVQPASL